MADTNRAPAGVSVPAPAPSSGAVADAPSSSASGTALTSAAVPTRQVLAPGVTVSQPSPAPRVQVLPQTPQLLALLTCVSFLTQYAYHITLIYIKKNV
jgi:hypothetical protein